MEKLGIDPKLLIAQLVNFGLFFFIFQKFIAKPFLGFIKDQEKKDREKLVFEENMRKHKEQLLIDEKKAKETMHKQVQIELSRAKQEAEGIKKSMLEAAKKEADEVLAQAKRQIDEEARLASVALKGKAADLSVSIVETSLKGFLNDNMQKEVTKHILSQVRS